MRFILLLALFFSAVYAQWNEDNRTSVIVQKVLYLSYVDVPERVFKGQIFAVTLKVLSTIGQVDNLTYTFSEAKGLRLLSNEPERIVKGKYAYDTFYFLAQSQWLKTPHIEASLLPDEYIDTKTATLPGKKIDVVTLNPASDFANIIAGDFNVTDYKTTSYNQKNNILVFSAKASQCALDAFHLNQATKQGAESIQIQPDLSTMTYYAVISKKLDNLSFTYFNLHTEKFINVLIPIIVDDDMVSTQSDLRPTEYKHKLLKIIIAGGIALTGLILLVIRKRWLYLILIILPGIYIAYAAVPISHVCIKTGTPIYLLPMTNGTVFETTSLQQTLEVEGEIKGYTKIKLENNKIGWIKNEDLCTP